MSNYIFKRTDPTNEPIVVQPYTVNGPSTPTSSTLYTNSLSGLSAVVESTSLVLTGKGVPEYGEFVQGNLIYLMEHFASPIRPRNLLQGQIWYKNTAGANPSFPSDPTTVGLYLWSGTAWTPIVLNSGGSGSGDLDLGGNKIINLGNPSAATDALNLGFADTRFLGKAAGGTVTGATTFNVLTVNGASSFSAAASFTNDVTFGSASNVYVNLYPTNNLHAANKLYVDNAIAAATGGPAQYLPLTGDTVNGPVTIAASANPSIASSLRIDPTVGIIVQPGTGSITFGGRVINDVGAPVSNLDAANKQYVDAAVAAGGGGTDIYLTSGVLSGGILTLTNSDASTVVVSGAFAAAVHTHTDGDVSYTIPIASQSYLTPQILASFPGSYPTGPLTNVMRVIDRGLYYARSQLQRYVLTAVGGETTVTIPEHVAYTVNENRLSVYKNGLKLVASERGNSRIKFNNVSGQTSLTDLAAGTYTSYVTIDGGSPVAINATVTSAGYTYRQIVNRINFIFQGQPSSGSAATAGRADISWTGLVGSSATGLTPATTYTATITVDGVAKAISILGSDAQTFSALINEINADLGGSALAVIQSTTNMRIASVTTGATSSVVLTTPGTLFPALTGYGSSVSTPGADAVPPAPTAPVYDATARLEEGPNSLTIIIESKALGNPSSITVSYAPGELFTSISASTAPVNTAVTVTRDYKEVGTVGAQSQSVLFASALTAGQVIEFITQP